MSALVKFLGGPQAGAEVLLPAGEFVLGSDDAADLFLVDAVVKPRHALLVIRDAAWEIEPLDGSEVRIDGERATAKTPVSPYQVLSFGGTHLALGPDGAWKTLPAIPAPAPEKDDGVSGEDLHGTNVPAGEKKEGAGQTDAAIAAKSDVNEPAARETRGGAAASGGGRKRSCLWVIIVLAIAAAAAVAYRHIEFQEDPGRQRAEGARERLLANGFSVADEEGDLALPGVVRIDREESGAVRLTGLLTTEAARRRAVDAAGLPENELRDGVTTVEAQLSSIARELERISPGVTVAPLGDGFVVALSGVADSASEAEAAYRLLRERLDARIGVRRRVWQWRELAGEAELEAERLGIQGARFLREEGKVRFMADSPPSPEDRRELAALLRERLGEQAEDFLVPALEDSFQSIPVPPPPPEETPEEAPEEEAAVPPESEAEAVVQEPEITSLREFWQVSAIDRDGFRDQSGRKWLIGDVLGNGLRLVGAWGEGAVFQRGTETLFVQRGAMMFDHGDAGPKGTEALQTGD